MGKTKKNNPYITLRVDQYWFYLLLFKNFTNLQQVLEITKNFALANKPKC